MRWLVAACLVLSVPVFGQGPKSIATNTKGYSDQCKVDWESARYFVKSKPGGKWEVLPSKVLPPVGVYQVATVRSGTSGTHFVVTDTIENEVLSAQHDCYGSDGRLRYSHLEFGRSKKWFWEQYFEMAGDQLKPRGKALFNSSDRKYILLDIPKDAEDFKRHMQPMPSKWFSDTPFMALLKQPQGSKK